MTIPQFPSLNATLEVGREVKKILKSFGLAEKNEPYDSRVSRLSLIRAVLRLHLTRFSIGCFQRAIRAKRCATPPKPHCAASSAASSSGLRGCKKTSMPPSTPRYIRGSYIAVPIGTYNDVCRLDLLEVYFGSKDRMAPAREMLDAHGFSAVKVALRPGI